MENWVIEYRIKPDGFWNLIAGEATLTELGKPELVRLANNILRNAVKFGIKDIEYRLRNIENNDMMNEEQIRGAEVPQMEGH